MKIESRITPCLWFDDQAEEATEMYVSIFPNSSIGRISRYTEAGQELHNKAPGSVMAIAYTLDGHDFTALNGGPMFKFTEAISLQINCETQDEVDLYWNGLSEGGDPNAQQCGWLKDKFGVSWQVVPRCLDEMMADPDAEKARRVTECMFQMKKLDIAELERAFAG